MIFKKTITFAPITGVLSDLEKAEIIPIEPDQVMLSRELPDKRHEMALCTYIYLPTFLYHLTLN